MTISSDQAEGIGAEITQHLQGIAGVLQGLEQNDATVTALMATRVLASCASEALAMSVAGEDAHVVLE